MTNIDGMFNSQNDFLDSSLKSIRNQGGKTTFELEGNVENARFLSRAENPNIDHISTSSRIESKLLDMLKNKKYNELAKLESSKKFSHKTQSSNFDKFYHIAKKDEPSLALYSVLVNKLGEKLSASKQSKFNLKISAKEYSQILEPELQKFKYSQDGKLLKFLRTVEDSFNQKKALKEAKAKNKIYAEVSEIDSNPLDIECEGVELDENQISEMRVDDNDPLGGSSVTVSKEVRLGGVNNRKLAQKIFKAGVSEDKATKLMKESGFDSIKIASILKELQLVSAPKAQIHHNLNKELTFF